MFTLSDWAYRTVFEPSRWFRQRIVTNVTRSCGARVPQGRWPMMERKLRLPSPGEVEYGRQQQI